MTDTRAEKMAQEVERTRDEPTHSPDGVDLTLVRWMLSLTPEERLEVLQSNVGSILRLQRLARGVATKRFSARQKK